MEPIQLDVYDVLALDTEERYAHDERMGKVLNDLLCDECPSPADCAAERECVGRADARYADLSLPEWDAIA